MKSQVKEISSTQKQIDIEIEAKAVKAAYDRISDRYAKVANVPGFRPGHAPRGVVRTRFKDQIRSEVLRELVPDAVQTAIADHNLEPLGEPELDLDSGQGLEPLGDKSMSFHVKIEVLPEIKLGNYKGVQVTRRLRPVKNEDVDREIESLEQLRTKVRSDLDLQAKNEADAKVKADLMRALVHAHQFDLPARLVNHQTEHHLESVVRDMIGQGIDPRNPKLDWDKARDSLKDQAGFDLR